MSGIGARESDSFKLELESLHMEFSQHSDPSKTQLQFKMQPGIEAEQNALVDVMDVAVSCDTSE